MLDAFKTVFGNLLSTMWWLPVALVFFWLLKQPFVKGMIGEFVVNLILSRSLNKAEYRLMKNVTLPTTDKDGKSATTQIDHIVVSQYGVFVIETKNYRGWIFGTEKQKTWTQKIYRKNFKFQNPLHQNYKHTQTLAALLELSPEVIHSVIVFVGSATFKTDMPVSVGHASDMVRYIKSHTGKVFNNTQLSSVITAIESGRLKPSLKTHRDHVAHVKEIVAAKDKGTASVGNS